MGIPLRDKMSTSELAMTYASLILHDEGADVTAENLMAVVKAAGIEVEPYWAPLFTKMLANRDIGDLISNVGAASAAPAAAAAPAAGGEAEKAPEPEPEPEPESEPEEEDMGFDLFD